MNRNDLVAHVASESGLSKAEASRAVDAMIHGITEGLRDGSNLRLSGFGTFSVSERVASEGRNPRTGEKIRIEASKLVKFKAGAELKRAVNGGRDPGDEE